MVQKRVNEIYARHLELQKKRFQNALSVKLSNNSSKDQIGDKSNHSPLVAKPSTLKKSKLKLNPK